MSKLKGENSMNYDELPANKSADVLVIGSGPAGIAAAVTLGRNNKDVLLIEKCGCVGGMSTAGLMSHWVGTVECKLYDEVIKKSCERENRKLNSDKKYINAEILKLTYLDLLKQAKVRLLLSSIVVDVLKDNNNITGVIVANKSGLETVKCKLIIDCSGDGDIAFKSGEQFVMGRETDGKMQPATLMFKVGGVRKFGAVYLGSFESEHRSIHGELQALAKKKLPYPAGHVLLYKSPVKGVTVCNMTNSIDINGTDNDDINKAYLQCCDQIPQIIDFLRRYVRGYRNCYLLSTAEIVGIRETRHIKGVYTISQEDIYAARSFDDAIVKNAYFNFDVHNVAGSGLDTTGIQKEYKQKNGYDIPYRALLPEKTDNLILAGRCISGTHMAHSNYRAMPICFAMGAAAGAACVLALEQSKPLKSISAKEIQRMLF